LRETRLGKFFFLGMREITVCLLDRQRTKEKGAVQQSSSPIIPGKRSSGMRPGIPPPELAGILGRVSI
jgi:hypothetical protein